MGKKKIVVDTNNLISAFGWNGNSRELLRNIIDKEFELFISKKQIEELKRVMDYPKLKFNEEQKTRFLEILFQIANVVNTTLKIDVIKENIEDNFLLECALEINADYIISGDEHLKKLKEYKNIKIVSVNEFLKLEK